MCACVCNLHKRCALALALTFSVSSVLLSKIKPMQLRTTSRRRALLNTELAFPVIDTGTQRKRTLNDLTLHEYKAKKLFKLEPLVSHHRQPILSPE